MEVAVIVHNLRIVMARTGQIVQTVCVCSHFPTSSCHDHSPCHDNRRIVFFCQETIALFVPCPDLNVINLLPYFEKTSPKFLEQLSQHDWPSSINSQHSLYHLRVVLVCWGNVGTILAGTIVCILCAEGVQGYLS